MLYAYQLRSHTNARYLNVLVSLSQKELRCMLHACGIEADVCPRSLGGTPFLCFESDPLTPSQNIFLSRHSALYMTAALEGETLRPIDPPMISPIPQDMPEILKYKGKTNSSFTRLLINLSLSAGGQWNNPHPRILDPLCGQGTTLFCALCSGMDATGIDSNAGEIREAIRFTQKWLEYHRISHRTEKSGYTLPGGKNAPVTNIRLQAGPSQSPQFITLILADTRFSSQLTRHRRANALAADLPYGVQHSPLDHGKTGTLEQLLSSALPSWLEALEPGCAAAISFNTYTLRRDTVERLAADAGFVLAPPALYGDFSHWVEQAVNRDIVVALRPM